jgi:hypothetical protein
MDLSRFCVPKVYEKRKARLKLDSVHVRHPYIENEAVAPPDGFCAEKLVRRCQRHHLAVRRLAKEGDAFAHRGIGSLPLFCAARSSARKSR